MGSWDRLVFIDHDTGISSSASIMKIKGGRRLLTTASHVELRFASRTRNGQGSDRTWSKSHFQKSSAHLGAGEHARSKHRRAAASDPEATGSFPGARSSNHRGLIVSTLTTVVSRFRKMWRSVMLEGILKEGHRLRGHSASPPVDGSSRFSEEDVLRNLEPAGRWHGYVSSFGIVDCIGAP